MDEEGDWEIYQKNGVLQYLQTLKDEKVVRHIGVSSHNPAIATAAVPSM